MRDKLRDTLRDTLRDILRDLHGSQRSRKVKGQLYVTYVRSVTETINHL